MANSEVSASLETYLDALRHGGELVVRESDGAFWQAGPFRSFSRRPSFCLSPPSGEQLRRLLWKHCSPVATYVCEPDAAHSPNAWLYLCSDPDYSLERLGSAARRDIRRARRAFRFEFIDTPSLLKNGTQAFCDTRRRVGLSDGYPEVFQRQYARFGDNPAHKIVGVWAQDSLAAFAALVSVDDWVEIFPYAADDHLKGCPVNGLLDFILNYFLVEHRFRTVNYGLSSIEEASSAAGLHAFKKKTGFDCIPVHRAFVFHPLIRPLVNRALLWIVRGFRRLWPGSPSVRKAAGIVAACLGDNPMPKDQETLREDRP